MKAYYQKSSKKGLMFSSELIQVLVSIGQGRLLPRCAPGKLPVRFFLYDLQYLSISYDGCLAGLHIAETRQETRAFTSNYCHVDKVLTAH